MNLKLFGIRDNIALIPKPDKDATRKENCRLISLRNTNTSKLNPTAH
jgi:hypothetical protein